MTLEQCAIIAEFDNDPEAAKALIVAANEGQMAFSHIHAEVERNRREAQERARIVSELKDENINVTDDLPPTARDLRALRNPETGEVLSVTDHAACLGHGAYIDFAYVMVDREGNIVEDAFTWAERDERGLHTESRQVARYYCSEPANHPGVGSARVGSRTADPAAADQADTDTQKREQRKLVIANNKAWDTATEVRRAAVKTYLGAAKAPEPTAAFLVSVLDQYGYLLGDWKVSSLLSEFVPSTEPLTTVAHAAKPARALVLALARVLASLEVTMDRSAWRRDNTKTPQGAYLAFLQDTYHYQLSDIEKFALTSQTV